MILKLIQTKRAPKSEYQVFSVSKNINLGSIVISEYMFTKANFELIGHTGEVILGKNTQTKDFKEKIKDALTFCVIENGVEIGNISGEIKNIKTFWFFGYGYQYTKIKTSSGDFCAYEFGTGLKGGHYWTVYLGEVVVGMIEKIQDTVNTYDQYDIYCEDENFGFWLVLLAFKIDNAQYLNYTQQFGAVKTTERYDSRFMPKELKDKYDPTFIPRIKAIDEKTE